MKLKKAIKTFALVLLLCSFLMTSCVESSLSEQELQSNESFISDISDVDFSESSFISEGLSEESYESIEESTSSEESSEYISEESSKDVSEEISETSSEDTELSYDPSYSEITIESAGERYADKFTDGEIISTEDSYISEFVNVTYKEITFEGKLYFVQDIYIKQIESFYVGFAGLGFGKKYNDYVPNIVKDYKNAGTMVIGAINGDYCGLDGKGVIIRNGKLYGTGVAEYTVCVLYKNGVMAIINKKQFNAERELERGAWHAWDFGPSFLNADGSPVETYTERTSIRGANPRSVIGYFEPGHYCFITAGGRKGESPYGVSYKQISRFCSSIGCKVAYNLDGGQSAVMVFNDKIVNEKHQGKGRKISDIVFIQDIEKESVSEQNDTQTGD